MDTPGRWGQLLALVAVPASAQGRRHVSALSTAIQAATSQAVMLVYVDQGDIRLQAANDAKTHGIELSVVELPQAQGAKHDCVLLPTRWVVEQSFAWTSRFQRLTRDSERMATILLDVHFLACTCLPLH